MTNVAELPDTRIWSVRAEYGNVLVGHFLDQGIVSMGWLIGPIGDDDSTAEIIERLAKLNPDAKAQTLRVWAAEIKRFNREMAVGDAVCTYDPQRRIYHIGIIRDLLIPAELGRQSEDPDYSHDYVHRVEWLYQVSRDILSQATRNSLGGQLTLFRLSPEASAELRGHCSGGR